MKIECLLIPVAFIQDQEVGLSPNGFIIGSCSLNYFREPGNYAQLNFN